MAQKTKSLGKPWKTLVTVGPFPRHLERAEAIARFRLTTGHDFWGVYLHWLGMVFDEACPLCSHVRMHGDHLLQRIGLDEYPIDDIVSRYWESCRQMIKKPSLGVGEINKRLLRRVLLIAVQRKESSFGRTHIYIWGT
ncbi:reverse transcriptase [Trichonephila clavipes]|nr:reverse transcriptase [Trichonephila clavipes]